MLEHRNRFMQFRYATAVKALFHMSQESTREYFHPITMLEQFFELHARTRCQLARWFTMTGKQPCASDFTQVFVLMCNQQLTLTLYREHTRGYVSQWLFFLRKLAHPLGTQSPKYHSKNQFLHPEPQHPETQDFLTLLFFWSQKSLYLGISS